jgi:hypothetical protein
MPQGGPDDINRQIRDADRLRTAMERSYESAAKKAAREFARISRAGEEMFHELEDTILSSIADGSEEGASLTAPDPI